MNNKEKELFQLAIKFIELQEYEIAKNLLEKLKFQDNSINDDIISNLAFVELKLSNIENAASLLFDCKHNFDSKEKYYNSLNKLGFKYYCPVGRVYVDRFYALPSMYEQKLRENNSCLQISDFETINIEEYQCKETGSNDRDRFYAMFLNKLVSETPIGQRLKILDFSPSKPFENYMRWNRTFDYLTADGLLDSYDKKVDVQNMTEFGENTFDGVICSHVLEHVPDDISAMREIYRVLKPGGWAILMVPINLSIENIDEDFTVTDINERWRRFGQDDHLRVYSKNDLKTELGKVDSN